MGHGVVWHGAHGAVWHVMGYGMAWAMAWHGMARHGTAWHGMGYGTVCHGTAWHAIPYGVAWLRWESGLSGWECMGGYGWVWEGMGGYAGVWGG